MPTATREAQLAKSRDAVADAPSLATVLPVVTFNTFHLTFHPFAVAALSTRIHTAGVGGGLQEPVPAVKGRERQETPLAANLPIPTHTDV